MRSHDYPNTLDYHQPIASNAVNPAIDPKRRYLCRHIFTDGHRCGSPSLRGRDLCYYHIRARRDAPCANRGGTFVMSRIEDRPSVQLAIYDVLSRVSAGDIEYKRGSVLLYGLQIASSNLARQEKLLADQPPQVEEVTSDYDLGDLAPIVEIPDASQLPDAAPTATPPQTPVSLSEAPQQSEGAQPKDPEVVPIPNALATFPPQKLAAQAPNVVISREDHPPNKAVIQNGVKAPCISPIEPTDDDAPDAAATTQPGCDLKPRTPPRTSNFEPRTLLEPRTSYPLPTHDATGRPYPPPHKLDPPSNGRVPRLRTCRTPPTSSPSSGLSQPATSN